MTDYLAEVSKPVRIIAIVALSLSTIVFGLSVAGLIVMALRKMPANAEQWKVAIGMFVVSGSFASMSLWMLLRLASEKRSRNGITSMPLWFIQFWGAIFAIVALASAILDRSLLMLVESLSIGAAMLFIRRAVRRKQQLEQAEQTTGCDRGDPAGDGDDFTPLPRQRSP